MILCYTEEKFDLRIYIIKDSEMVKHADFSVSITEKIFEHLMK